jgi:hypothetical protein
MNAATVVKPEVCAVISVTKLKNRTVKDLAEMARKKKVPGWHAMRKDELVHALARRARAEAARRAHTNGNGRSNGAAKNGKSGAKNGAKVRNPRVERRIQQIKARLAAAKDLSFKSVTEGNGHTRDRLVVMVRDPYWLHAYWELSQRSIERAKAAMGQHWHGARPVLRVDEVTRNGTTTSAKKFVRDIEIHGGVTNWYVDVQNPPKSYQLEIGYLSPGGKFFALARSNVVTTPLATAGDAFDKNWADVAKDFDRIYAMSGGYLEQDTNRELKEVFEERLQRPMGESMSDRFGPGAGNVGGRPREFNFKVDTELIVHGVTEPSARVTLRGEPVHLRPDGSFAVRFNLPDRRHVLPVVASSGDGGEQRTIVLAVDRNTKVMEPVMREPGE